MNVADGVDPRGVSLETVNLGYAYPGDRPALEEVSVRIEPGEFTAVIGQNASGKTTLAKHFNGLLRPSSGRALVDGRDIGTRPVAELARYVGYTFQNPDHQIFSATVREEVAFGPRNFGWTEAQVDAAVDQALREFGLLDVAALAPAELGFGLRRKVSLASVVAARPLALLLDEPTAGLDSRATADLMRTLASLNTVGTTILLITHDLRLVAEHAPRCLLLHEGRVLAHAETRAVLMNDEVMARAQMEPPQVARLSRRMESTGLPPGLLTTGEFCSAYEALFRSRTGASGAGGD